MTRLDFLFFVFCINYNLLNVKPFLCNVMIVITIKYNSVCFLFNAHIIKYNINL